MYCYLVCDIIFVVSRLSVPENINNFVSCNSVFGQEDFIKGLPTTWEDFSGVFFLFLLIIIFYHSFLFFFTSHLRLSISPLFLIQSR